MSLTNSQLRKIWDNLDPKDEKPEDEDGTYDLDLGDA